jgi:hypothetical protein
MRPELVSWRPSGLSSSAPADGGVEWSRYVAIGGALLAIGLLIGFYWVVSSLVQRAEHGREQARFASDRQVVCGAFSNASSRELCASTLAAHVPPNAVLQAAYEHSTWSPRKRQLTASLH